MIFHHVQELGTVGLPDEKHEELSLHRAIEPATRAGLYRRVFFRDLRDDEHLP